MSQAIALLSNAETGGGPSQTWLRYLLAGTGPEAESRSSRETSETPLLDLLLPWVNMRDVTMGRPGWVRLSRLKACTRAKIGVGGPD